MSYSSVYCLASARAPADLILHELRIAGVSPKAISVLFLDQRAAGTAAGDAPAAPSSTEIRGVVEWLGNARAVTISSGGPLIVAGPLADAFDGDSVSGISATLADFGLPDTEAAHCEGRVLDGGTLLAVHDVRPDRVAAARDLFAAGGAESIFTLMTISSPAKSPESRAASLTGDGRPDAPRPSWMVPATLSPL